MASLLIFSFVPSTTRVYAKGAGGSKEEKGLLDWILGNLTKEDQFYETDPLLKKVEDKNGIGGGTTSGRKNSVSISQKKKGNGNGGGFGLGGLSKK
ncbi:cytochrome P450 86A1-like [Hibiscus syriacus]|uniref:Cytochrome P450 86A1-like n=1 Tax=Hibiscus syriacus TaxID=106335 RepID=A0A6A2ZBA4_HIBSY|nr:cytochrome P450 86A1-like [Hibiscus syriacus]